MSSDAFEQFAENFGCWITDHGATGAHGGHITDGSWPATIHLPTLEAAIRDLITEARAMVAADTLIELDSAAGKLEDNWRITQVLEPVRAELTEIADPGGECAQCGHIDQPEYRHGTTDHARARRPGSRPEPGNRGRARDLLDEMLNDNAAATRKYADLMDDDPMLVMLRRERRELTDRVINLASLDSQPLPHPPVPEQAATAQQAAWIAENQDLWHGWAEGRWPAHHDLDPRGFVWEAMP